MVWGLGFGVWGLGLGFSVVLPCLGLEAGRPVGFEGLGFRV